MEDGRDGMWSHGDRTSSLPSLTHAEDSRVGGVPSVGSPFVISLPGRGSDTGVGREVGGPTRVVSLPGGPCGVRHLAVALVVVSSLPTPGV